MVLPLITPVGSNFIKDWPAQNTVNCNLIDDYAGPCMPGHALSTYTPILTAATTNPVLGNGTIVGFYYRIFDQIYTWGEFRYGSTSTVGSGTYEISLPFRAKTLVGIGAGLFSSPPVVGNGVAYDESAAGARQPILAVLRSVDKLGFSVRMGTAGASRRVNELIPFTWAAGTPGDGISWAVRYQRDPT